MEVIATLLIFKEIVCNLLGVAVCLVCLKLIVNAWLLLAKNDNAETETTVGHGEILRALWPHEVFFHRSYRYNVFALFLESPCQLSAEVIKQTLKKASQKHELLRCRLRTLENNGNKTFVFTQASFEDSIDFQDVTLENYEDIMEAMTVGGLHLWSARFVQLTSFPTPNKGHLNFYCGECSCVLLLGFHPAVADGVSMHHFCNAVMKSMNGLFFGNEIGTHDSAKLVQHDMLPVELNSAGSKWVVLENVIKTVFERLVDIMQTRCFTRRPKAISIVDWNQQQRARTILLEFSRSKLEHLRHSCHSHGATMHGALSAIATLALTQSHVDGADDRILGGKNETPIKSQYFTNYRKLCKNDVTGDVMGCLTCPFTTRIKVCEHDEFWDIARKLTVEIHDKNLERAHLRELQQNMLYNDLFYCKNELLNRVLNDYQRPQPLQYYDFAISDLNDHNVILSNDSDKVFVDKIACVVGFSGNCNFVHTTMTLQSRLLWSLSYNTSTVTREMADVYSGKIKLVFSDAINERR